MPLCVCVLTLMECVGFQKGTSEHERTVHFFLSRPFVCVCVYLCLKSNSQGDSTKNISKNENAMKERQHLLLDTTR